MDMSQKKRKLEKFLGETVRIRLKAPSGKTVLLPEDTLIYKEGVGIEREGFYLSKQRYRLMVSQFAGDYIISTSHGKLPVLLFEVGKKIMEPMSHELIKNGFYKNLRN